MNYAIHIELDLLFLVIQFIIAHQINKSVSKQTNRMMFRMLVYGIIGMLCLDALWMLVEGTQFPGAILLNTLINAVFLGAGVLIGGLWYLYVLDSLGYRITKRLQWLILLPGIVFIALNLVTIRTGWIFTISPDNRYVRGHLFWLQIAGALLMLFVSLIHILLRMLRKGGNTPEVRKLLKFYIVPVIGTLASLPFTGMPGTWPCASVSIVMMYMDRQDAEIVRDSLTGLNNRKTLAATFAEYIRQASAQRGLFLFMMDLNKFKSINDQFGHPAGDEALVAAAGLLKRAVAGKKAVVARFGGDEFLIMGFMDSDEDAEAYSRQVRRMFRDYNRDHALPYELGISIGFSRYRSGMDMNSLIHEADEKLYIAKRAG